MPILALHGFTGRGSDFAPLSQQIGVEWYCPDLPGHGPNPQLDCSQNATDDFISDQQSNANILLGYSMGARAALLHAIQHPSRWKALILISPNPGIEDKEERLLRKKSDSILAERIEADGITSFLNYWQNTPLIRSQKAIQSDWYTKMQESRMEHTTVGLAASLRDFGQGAYPNLWPKISKLTMPTLIVSGQEDSKYTKIAARIARAAENVAMHQIISEASHAPHLEAPDAFIQRVDLFLKDNAQKV